MIYDSGFLPEKPITQFSFKRCLHALGPYNSDIRKPHLQCFADLPEISHLQADDQGTVGQLLADLLRGEDLASPEVIGRLGIRLDEHLQVALLAKPDVGLRRDFPCKRVSYRIHNAHDRSAADRGFFPMV